MNLFDILGPVMVGPSSSHTAGAVRIGWMTQKLLGEQPVEAKILMYGSFAATGKGHGTDRGLVAGLLGMRPDDERIPDSFEIARKMGLSYSFGIANLTSAHPNSVVLKVKGKSGRTLDVQACSLGGGTPSQITHAAAMALKNLLGLVCDPVGGLVEVPCVKRNVIGSVNALSAADMALAGIISRIPPDQVIDAMREVGDQMHPSLRETGQGGLANTPAAREWCAAQEEE